MTITEEMWDSALESIAALQTASQQQEAEQRALQKLNDDLYERVDAQDAQLKALNEWRQFHTRHETCTCNTEGSDQG